MSKFTKFVQENGYIEYRNEQDQLHREDGPARIWADGVQEWCHNGLCHREDGPAWIEADGSQKWYQNGELHRVDGPAIITADGHQDWWLYDRRHREGGPARIWADGSQEWWVNGRRHREDGPAVIMEDGYQQWWLINVNVGKELVKNLNSLTVAMIHKRKNVELRSWLIQRLGWPKYLKEINAEPIDVRNNEIENTKEALYWISELNQNQLVVTCPTGRVFNLHVPDRVMTCEAAQRWLGNDTKKKFNVIGRT